MLSILRALGIRAQYKACSIWDPQFLIDVMHVDFYSALSKAQILRDNFIGKPLRHELGNLRFSPRQHLTFKAAGGPNIHHFRHEYAPSVAGPAICLLLERSAIFTAGYVTHVTQLRISDNMRSAEAVAAAQRMTLSPATRK